MSEAAIVAVLPLSHSPNPSTQRPGSAPAMSWKNPEPGRPAMTAFIGRRIRFSTAPSGSEMIDETASAALEIQSVAVFHPDFAAPLILSQIPPSAKAAKRAP